MKRRMKRFAEGGMSDEERYGKVGAEIRRLDPEAYKNRPRSAEGNLKLLEELRNRAKTKPTVDFAKEGKAPTVDFAKEGKVKPNDKAISAGVKPDAWRSHQGGSGGPLLGKTIAITGSLSRPRGEVEELIKKAGGKPASSVTSKTFALVLGDGSMESSKSIRARELGIPVWNEEQLFTYLGVLP